MIGPAQRTRRYSGIRETALVGLGAIVALALGWAGWMLGRTPDELAEAEVASTARLVVRDVIDHWEGLRSGPQFQVFSDGSLEALRRRADDARTGLPQRRATLAQDPDRPRAFVTLFREASRLAKAGKSEEARIALDEALATGTLPEDAPALRLLELRLTLRSGERGAVIGAWDRLVQETDWADTVDEQPVRLVASWIAAEAFEGAQAQELRRSVAGAGAPYVIGAPSPNDAVEHADGIVRLIPAVETVASLAVSDSIWPGIADELRSTAAWARRTELALNEVLAVARDQVASPTYAFVDTALGLAAIRGGDPGFFVDKARLAERLQESLPLPPGFTLSLVGGESSGELLLDPFELEPLRVPVQLHHQNPSRLIRQNARRRRVSAWSLVGLGLACIAAALVAARALRRERRVAELRSTFVAGISHDLRTPLASILLMADNLRHGRVKPGRAAEYADGIASEAERLRRRVDDILDFARLERGEPSPAHREDVDLPALAGEILDEAEAQSTEAGFQFERDCETLPARAQLDPDALRRIVLNLVQNAHRHSGGHRVRVTFTEREGQLEVTVSDDGCGIPAKDRWRVLVAFERRDNAINPKGGTGLGLAIVAGLVDGLGGTLHIDDGVHGGARFTVQIPMEEDTV